MGEPNRKNNTQISFWVSVDTREKINKCRGLVPQNVFIRALLETAIEMYEKDTIKLKGKNESNS